ncbi:OmpA family protein [Christiangramia flava]|uniref:OmpA family protein n=1 Tax=Christiangramia flava TaxID=1486245 RepID=UPI0009FA1E3E|nr:OmpA family protein [Christiangramia flava]
MFPALPNRSFLLISILLIFLFSARAQTKTEVIPAGSYALNLGVTPQTKSNALKPYGFLYQLLKENQVEVKWVINPEKKKDGIDFSMGGQDFRSGSFIIPVSYITPKVRELIEKWEAKGVLGMYLPENRSLPVYTELSVVPKWTLDKQNGSIALSFFKAAAIPSEAYGGNSPEHWKTPAELDICDDIFVMPHAEPKFDSHQNLYYWNTKFKGAIWAGCHAGSMLENLHGTGRYGEKIIQLNFLSAGAAGARTTGLIPYYEHRYATPPYQNQLASDPVAQYIGKSDQAMINGSERIFYPKKANAWRKETRQILIDTTTPDIPELSSGPGCVVIYGHAFDEPKNGLVMYQASHDISGDAPQNIAALRMFFNYSFYATEIKRRENIIQFQNIRGDRIFAARVGDDLAKMLKLDPIVFDLDKAVIKSKAAKELDEIAAYMVEYPELLLDIRSHTDSRADDVYNIRLSEDRVKATRNYLIEKGVDSLRISGRGYGENEPVNNCRNGVPCSEADHERNRRSEFILSINCDLYEGKIKL